MVFVLLLSSLLACSAGSSVETAESSSIRDELTLTDGQGKSVSLEDSADKYLLVNFWATWCRPCIAELPSITALRDSLGNEPIEFILVTNESPEQTGNFLQDKGINIPGYHMPDAVDKFQLVGFPTTLVISPEGEIVLKIEGAIEWNDASNVNRIRRLMSEG